MNMPTRQVTGVSERPVQEQQSYQRRSEVRGPGPELAGRPVGQDEPEGTGEHGGPGKSIGSPVSAFDDDGELLIYTLGGADASIPSSLSRSRRPTQDEGLRLNFEARNSYSRGRDRHRSLGGRGQYTGDHQRHQRARPGAYNRIPIGTVPRERYGAR